MQYVLTEDEYNALLEKSKQQRRMPSKEDLQKFCTMVAETLPVASGWYKGKVWGCVLSEHNKSPCGYCDDCPAKDVCPYDNKEWSK